MFEGKAVFDKKPEKPRVLFYADYLKGDFGKKIYKRYVRKIEELPRRSSILIPYLKDAIRLQNDEVKGSNPLTLITINSILEEEDCRIPTLCELEKIIKQSALYLPYGYVETAIAVIKKDKDSTIEHLLEQLEERKIKPKFPFMISLKDFESWDFPPLRLYLKKELRSSDVSYAPQFRPKNDKKVFSEQDENGLPIFSKEGCRMYKHKKAILPLTNSRNIGVIRRDCIGTIEYVPLHLGESSDGRIFVIKQV